MRWCRVACVFWSTLCCIASYVRIVSAVLPGECAASETSACRVRTGARHCTVHTHRLHLLLLLPPPLFLFLLLLLLLPLLLLLLLHVRVLCIALASDVVYSTCAASQSDVCRSASDHYGTGATARCTAHAAARAETQRIGKRRKSSGYSPLDAVRTRTSAQWDSTQRRTQWPAAIMGSLCLCLCLCLCGADLWSRDHRLRTAN